MYWNLKKWFTKLYMVRVVKKGQKMIKNKVFYEKKCLYLFCTLRGCRKMIFNWKFGQFGTKNVLGRRQPLRVQSGNLKLKIRGYMKKGDIWFLTYFIHPSIWRPKNAGTPINNMSFFHILHEHFKSARIFCLLQKLTDRRAVKIDKWYRIVVSSWRGKYEFWNFEYRGFPLILE